MMEETRSMSFASNSAAAAGSYRRQLTPKQMEAEVYARATRALREAMDNENPAILARALADNRRLWDAVLAAVIDPSNRLPVPLRAQIASLARSVLRECDAESPDTDLIIEVNEQIAAALWV
jgi:flagellar biosynthesis regulator FlaF